MRLSISTRDVLSHMRRLHATKSFALVLYILLALGHARASQQSSSQQLAATFMSFCLHSRLSAADMAHRAGRLGAKVERIVSFDANFGTTHWRDEYTRNRFLLSFTISNEPNQDTMVLSCSVSGKVPSIAEAMTIIAKALRLPNANRIADPSIAADHETWFFTRNGAPYWVSVSINPFATDRSMIVSVATHQRHRK